ncbi:MAG: EAL domain-containing protein [Proteobacteria bacterium]|nr:EAL domain-containing protein [Pseudomonadota bacterium]
MHAEKTDPPQSVIPYVGDESHFSRLAAVIPCMLYDYVLKPDGSSQFLYVGPKCREILELSEDDLLADAGMFWELVLAEDMERLKSEDRVANRKGTSFSAEVRIRTRSGCLKWILLSSRPNLALLGDVVVWSGFMLDITDRKQAEEALRASEELLREMSRVAKVGGWNLDLTTNKLTWTAEIYRIREVDSDYQPQLEEGINCYAPEARPVLRESMERAVTQGVSYDLELPFITAKGNHLWVRTIGNADRVDGRTVRLYGIFQDITKRKQAEDALKSSEERLRQITDIAPVLLAEIDKELCYRFVNHRYSELFGLSPEAFYGQHVRKIIGGQAFAQAQPYMLQALAGQPVEFEVELPEETLGGRKVMAARYAPRRDESGQVAGFVAAITNITERKQAEEEIKQLAFYDPLTQLPNRRLLLDRLQQALATSVRSRLYGALLFIDLDNFKTLNDTLGHDKGDLLLQEVASRISACVRECDTVARLGGDEFVVMLIGMDGDAQEATAQTQKIGRKILAMLNQVYSLADHEHYGSASIGITLFVGHSSSMDELLKQADIALYQAKAAGRNALCFFDAQMQSSIIVRATLLNDLRHALAKNQFKLFCQAEVGHDQKMIGVEVLLRWDHPKQGLISPHDFIPLAEETGLIQPIGQWVLESACALLKSWERNTEWLHLYVAVNISVRQFHQPNFVNRVLEIVRDTGIDTSKLMLELTETLVLADLGDAVAKMNTLKEVGIRFALDDFGTGYSSLAYLTRLPFNQLKIDQSFVQHLAPYSNDLALCEAIVVMAHKLGIKVIAEGIETQGQCDILKQIGCDYGQGYLFSKPLPADEFERLIMVS